MEFIFPGWLVNAILYFKVLSSSGEMRKLPKRWCIKSRSTHHFLLYSSFCQENQHDSYSHDCFKDIAVDHNMTVVILAPCNY